MLYKFIEECTFPFIIQPQYPQLLQIQDFLWELKIGRIKILKISLKM